MPTAVQRLLSGVLVALHAMVLFKERAKLVKNFTYVIKKMDLYFKNYLKHQGLELKIASLALLHSNMMKAIREAYLYTLKQVLLFSHKNKTLFGYTF